MLWLTERKDPPVNWDETTLYYRDFKRSVTLSEYDHAERMQVYFKEQDIPQNEVNGCDFVPTNFLSSFFIQTHKGTSLFGI